MSLASQPTVAVDPSLFKDMGFDPAENLTPAACGVNAPVCIVAFPLSVKSIVAQLSCERNIRAPSTRN
jgi:hypothetical protein